MRRNLSYGVALAILALWAGVAIESTAQAKAPKAAAKNNAANNTNNTSQPSGKGTLVSTLTQAHTLLMDADHDYDGRRHRAAVAVGKALKALGAAPAEMDSIRTRHERQSASDAQLLQAKQILQSVLAELGGNNSTTQKGQGHARGQKGAAPSQNEKGTKKASKNVGTAIEEIETALKIR
jgi:hypothetical protein